MPLAPKVTLELRQTLSSARKLPDAEQRFIAAAMEGAMKQLACFAHGPGSVLEDIVLNLMTDAETADQFILYKSKLRPDLPVAVSRHFVNSYGSLDSEGKYAIRKHLNCWSTSSVADSLLITQFRNDQTLSWVQFGTLATGVLSQRGEQSLWTALLRPTSKPISFARRRKTKVNPKLRAYLDAL